MGMWDIQPWDNDQAADWYAGFMGDTNFREHWLKGINESIEDGEADAVRAAAALFIMLGRVYIWPIEHYDNDLQLVITRLNAVMTCEEYQECEELVDAVKAEIQELENRQTPGYRVSNPRSTWW